jgi:hypothetical protein
VAHPVLGQRARLAAAMAADQVRAPRGLVDVVADEHHQVEVLGLRVAVRDEVALLEHLARAEAEAHRACACRRRGAGAARGARVVAGVEAVEEPAAGLEAADLDVHAVRAARQRVHGAALHDAGEALVVGDLPADRDCLLVHAAVRGQGLRGESRPQHDARRGRRPRRDAERERVAVGHGRGS